MKIKFTWPVLIWLANPLEFSFLALTVFHLSSEYFVVWEDNYSLAVHFAFTETSFIPYSLMEDYESLPMKHVIFELSMVLKLIVFENSFFPVSLLELSLECVVRSIFFAVAFKVTISEIASVVVIIVLERESVAVGLIVLKISHENPILKIIFSIAFFLFVFVQFPPKDGLSKMIYFGLFDVFLVLKT